MKEIPDNLVLLHQGEEEEIRPRSLAALKVDGALSAHLHMVEKAMDVLDILRQNFHATDDERAISHLAIRTFNSFATSWKVLSSGYYQVATLILRDAIETIYLVNAFSADRSLVAKWRTADRQTLIREFGPASIRKLLDAHMGHGKSRRGEIYAKFSTLAAHPSVDGFAMLRPKDQDAHNGPFFDPTALRAVLEEAGMLAVQAGFAFSVFLDTDLTPPRRVCRYFLVGAMKYSNEHLGLHYSDADLAEVARIYGG